MIKNNKKILVIGGTGYVGNRLVASLLDIGYPVRVTYRNLNKIKNRIWFNHPNLEVIYTDVFDQESLIDACKGISVVYYLVHSMYPKSTNFMHLDRVAARNTAHASYKASAENIIYLGGLGAESKNISKHLKSRAQVGNLLQAGNVPTTVLRAAMIIGSGSTSFEMLRYLVDRLPVMITPKWVYTNNQPIAIRNVIEYLIGCAQNEETIGKTFDIGGPKILNYRELMDLYAIEANLNKRMVISLPVNDPLQSTSFLISRLIPIDQSIIAPLVESLRNEVICDNNKITEYIPQVLLSPREAIRRTLVEIKQVLLHDTFQSEGWRPPMSWSYIGDPEWSGGSLFFDRRAAVLEGDINDVWKTVSKIGGKNGWYHGNILWKFRGFLDEFVGGPGIRRGRINPNILNQGEILDCWRIRRVVKQKELLLSAEMKLPGHATLNFKLTKKSNNKVILDQIACFAPHGLGGILYWQAVLPFHVYIFNGMIKSIAKKAKCKIIYGPKYLKRYEQIN